MLSGQRRRKNTRNEERPEVKGPARLVLLLCEALPACNKNTIMTSWDQRTEFEAVWCMIGAFDECLTETFVWFRICCSAQTQSSCIVLSGYSSHPTFMCSISFIYRQKKRKISNIVWWAVSAYWMNSSSSDLFIINQWDRIEQLQIDSCVLRHLLPPFLFERKSIPS